MWKVTSLLVLGLAQLAGCRAPDDTGAASNTAASTSTAPAPDCSQLGSFSEEAMKGIGGATYVRAEAAPSNSLQTFTLGPLADIPGWAGKNADYTRDLGAPCLDIVTIGSGRDLRENEPLPMTESCAGQRGRATVMMDNPALGAFLAFEDASGLPFGKDTYFVTGSQLDPAGKVTALCLSNAATGDRFLMTRSGS